METFNAGSYTFSLKKGSWGDFDYYDGVHSTLGMKVMVFVSRTESEQVPLDSLKKLRKLGFESVMKVFDIFYENGFLYVVTEPEGPGTLFDYFYTLNRPLDPLRAIEVVLPVLEALEELHNLGYAVGFLDESVVFFMQGKKVKIGGNWLIHLRNCQTNGEFELGYESLNTAKVRDVARCGAILFRLLNQETLLQTNLRFSSIMQVRPASIPSNLMDVIQKAVDIENPAYHDASGMIHDLKVIAEGLQEEQGKKFDVPVEAGRVKQGPRVKVTAILKGSETIADSTADNLIKEKSRKPSLSVMNIFLILLIVTITAGGLLYLFKGSLFGSKPNPNAAKINEELTKPPKLQMTDTLKIVVMETIEVVLQSAATGRDTLFVKQNTLETDALNSLAYYTALYNGALDLKNGNFDSSYARLDRAAGHSNRSLFEADAPLALGCYSMLKNDGTNAWLFLTHYSELIEKGKKKAGTLSNTAAEKIALKESYLKRLVAGFK